jgi:hypothetical protein
MKSGQNPYKTAKPVILEIPKSVVKQKNNDETEEFKRLITLSSSAHKEKTVKLLNQLFDKISLQRKLFCWFKIIPTAI